MNTAVERFKRAYITATSMERVNIMRRVSNDNSPDTRITNMIDNMDIKNADIQHRLCANNIHYVCKMLMSYPEFVFNG